MKRILASTLVAALLPLSALAGVYTFQQNTGFFTTSTGIAHGEAVTWGLSGSTNPSNYNALWADINTYGKSVTSATLTLTGIYDWQGEGTSTAQLDSADALFINILGGLNAGISSKVFAPQTGDDGDSKSDTWSEAVNPFVNNTTASSYNNRLQTNTQAGYTASILNFQDATTGSLLKSTDADQSATSSTLAGLIPAGVSWTDTNGGAANATTVVINFTSTNLSVLRTLLDADAANNGLNVGLGFAAECHFYMTGVTLNISTDPVGVPDSGSTLVLMGLGLGALVGFRRSRK